MARVHPLQAALNAGEFSPGMMARVDFGKYGAATSASLNCLSLAQGGATRRPGTRFVAELKSSSSAARLLDFEFSVDQAYAIEAGDQYLRFFRNQAPILVGGTDAAFSNGDFASNINGWTDVSTGPSAISHDATNGRLNLDGNGSALCATEQAVSVGPSFENTAHVIQFSVYGLPTDEIIMAVGTTSGATDIVDNVRFRPGHHCYELTPGAPSIYVRFHHSVSKTIQLDDVSFLDDAPVELASFYTADLLDQVYTTQSADTMYIAAGGTVPIYKLLRFGHKTWSLVSVDWQDGPYLDENTTPTTMTPASTAVAFGVTFTASSVEGINNNTGFQETDVGRPIRYRVNDTTEAGWGVIAAVNSTTEVLVDIYRKLSGTGAITTWSLGAWSGTDGYPRALTFYEQRLVTGGSIKYPQRFWFSQSADLENMRPDSFAASTQTVEDDDAMDYTIAAEQVNAVLWMSPGKKLLFGTHGGEWTFTSSGAALTPTDIAAKQQTANGSASIRPVRVSDALLYLQRAKRKVREFVFSFQDDGYVSPDMTQLANRISRSGIAEMAYQQEPNSLVWTRRNDGVVATLTYKRDEDVVGWGRHKMGGTYAAGDAVVESVATIPGRDGAGQVYNSEDRDEVWMIVKRTIDGQTKRYVEFLEGMFEGPDEDDYDTPAAYDVAVIAAQKDAFYVDSGMTYDGPPTTTISGLLHLEGQVVTILADGATHPARTVENGSIELDIAASKVHVGFAYTHRLTSMKLNAGTQAGTALGQTKRVSEITVILLESSNFRVGQKKGALELVEFRNVSDAMDTAVPLFTGEHLIPFPGDDDTDPRLIFESDTPLPWTLLGFVPELNTKEGV